MYSWEQVVTVKIHPGEWHLFRFFCYCIKAVAKYFISPLHKATYFSPSQRYWCISERRNDMLSIWNFPYNYISKYRYYIIDFMYYIEITLDISNIHVDDI